MRSITPRLRRWLFSVSPDETRFARRGFHTAGAATQEHLERVGHTFIAGYNLALEVPKLGELAQRLDEMELSHRGFAYEGAAMALTVLDHLTPWNRNRLRKFSEGPGNDHEYMVYVGAGWALARLRRSPSRFLARAHPLHGWLAVDGYGFHEGYFNWRRHYEQQVIPARLRGYERRAFDQGLGRCLWFVKCADTERVARTIADFPPSRRADLWSGVGLACAYAGGIEAAAIRYLQTLSVPYTGALAQGAAFAAQARTRANNMVPHTDLACTILCGCATRQAAQVTVQTLKDLSSVGNDPAYEMWRRRIQTELSKEAAIA